MIMKTIIKNVRMLSIAFLLTFSFSISNAIAQDGSKNSPEVEFKFIGNSNDQPVFQLDIQFADKNELTVTIKDKDDNIIYFEKVTKSISRKFQMNSESIGNGPLRIEVKDKNSKKTEAFEVVRNTRVVEESVITKVK